MKYDLPDYRPQPSRRTILKGMGAALTLPWLESLAWATGGKAAVTAGPPRRWAALIFANGAYPEDWWVRPENGRLAMGRTLAPLQAYQDDLLFLNGLHLFDKTTGVHLPYFTNLLSGEKIEKSPIPDLAESLDYYMARTIGRQTPIPVLNLGIEPTKQGIQGGLPSIYRSTISWSSEKTPVPAEIFPRAAFDRLFDLSRFQRDRSVLDAVRTQAKSLQTGLDYYDRQKMEAYLTSVRDIEHRLELASSEERFEGWRPTLEKPNMDRPPEGTPESIPEHMKLMIDIIVLAFQMDKTRLATLLFNNDTGGMRFGFLDGVNNASMHGGLSHHQNKPATIAMYQKVNRFHVELFAYMLDKMRAIEEGSSTLLDNSMVLFGSSMMDGDSHDADSGLPLVIAGRGGGTIQPGRVLTYEQLEDRRLCNLHLAMLNRMGVNDTKFGNSHYPLPGLSG